MIIEDAFNQNDILQSAMQASIVRNDVIQNNIANVDTPNFKRSEVSYESSLQQAVDLANASNNPVDLNTVSTTVYKPYDQNEYRIDGNNVDIEREMLSLYENSVRYSVMTNAVMNNYKRINIVLNAR